VPACLLDNPACLLDSKVWLAAAFAEHPAHAVARGVLRTASAEEPALWCRATQQSFLRLASTPVITAAYNVPKATNGDAWAALWVCGPKIAPEFLLFVFRAMSKEFERLKYGSTHNTIYMPDIFSFRVALASLIEQGEIVSNVRESLRRLIDVRGLVPEAKAA